jgi:hypothetical protein
MIRIPSLAIAAIVFAATLAGCLRSSVTVIVKKDGSAIVRDSMLFSGFMGMMTTRIRS